MNDITDSFLAQRAFARNRPTADQVGSGCDPIPPSKSVIQLPKDQYLHLGAPTEWWWHTGTLQSLDGVETFGFEINAASFQAFGFTQVMLTRVSNNSHSQNSTVFTKGDEFNPDTWAQSDVNKDWSVKLGTVSMHAPQSDPTKNMLVTAALGDGANNVQFDLKLCGT